MRQPWPGPCESTNMGSADPDPCASCIIAPKPRQNPIEQFANNSHSVHPSET